MPGRLSPLRCRSKTAGGRPGPNGNAPGPAVPVELSAASGSAVGWEDWTKGARQRRVWVEAVLGSVRPLHPSRATPAPTLPRPGPALRLDKPFASPSKLPGEAKFSADAILIRDVPLPFRSADDGNKEPPPAQNGKRCDDARDSHPPSSDLSRPPTLSWPTHVAGSPATRLLVHQVFAAGCGAPAQPGTERLESSADVDEMTAIAQQRRRRFLPMLDTVPSQTSPIPECPVGCYMVGASPTAQAQQTQ